MNEPDRQSRLDRLHECVRLAESAYAELYEPRTLQPAGPYSDAKALYAEAIGLARELGLNDEAEMLEDKLAHVKEVFRGQFEGHRSASTPVPVKLWPPQAVLDRPEQEMKLLIRGNASYVVDIGMMLTTFGFTYDAETVKWLDGFINYLRTRSAPIQDFENPLHDYDLWARAWRMDDHDDVVSHLGAYLGEAIICNYGGEWDCDEHGWHVRFDERNRVYPLGKVAKQLAHGAEESIFDFYAAIPLLYRR